MSYKRTSILPYMTCCICGKKVGRDPVDSYLDGIGKKNYETVITKRNTVVKFHTRCYDELVRKTRRG